MRSFPLNAQFFIDGQTKFTDGATVSRQINLMATPSKKKDKSAVPMIQNCMENVLELFKDEADIAKFLRMKLDIMEEYQSEMTAQNYKDIDRTIQNYAGIAALGRRMGLNDKEYVIKNVMMDQLRRNE